MRRMRHIKAREFQGCDIAYDFSNPASLYDATSGGSLVAADGAIARANDLSGGSGHMTQGTSANRPLRKVAALNGLDVARFDGSNDCLTAGDVADLLDKPVEMYVVHKKSGSADYQGIFGKSRVGAAKGKWSFLSDKNSNKHTFILSDRTTTTESAVGPTRSTNLEILHGYGPRTAGTNASVAVNFVNGKTEYATTGYTADTGSINTTDQVCIAVYQDSSGAPGSFNYYAGDIGECAKYSVTFTSAQRCRLDMSRCRKWRIAS